LGRYEEVFKEAQASYDIDPACGGAKLFEVQARSYYALKDYDQALVYINQALAAEQYALGYYYRGIIYQAAGRDREAIQDLEYFLSLSTMSLKESADAKARLQQLKP
jgi:tetratricopeptide (TPR) repeat protein